VSLTFTLVELFLTGYVNSTLSAITGFNKLYYGVFQPLSMLLQCYYNVITMLSQSEGTDVKVLF
jgi:hypothetical protein